MIGLGDLPGNDFRSVARGVSADGSVVVGWSYSTSGREAFIWDHALGMRSLRDVLTGDFGLDLANWRLSSTDAITPDGTTIVGTGVNPSGQREGWIATIPEPGAVSLLVLGGVGLMRRKRTR